MRRVILMMLIAGGFSFCTSVEERVVSSLFRNYVSAQEALAADNFDEAQEALNALAAETDADVSRAASDAAKAEDIEAIRAAFKRLSEEVSKKEVPEGFVVAFCPMADEGKGAPWVQKDGEIANPYFGSKMLRCGTIQSEN